MVARKQHEEPAGYNRGKRRPGTQPLKDAHPAATVREMVVRKMTAEQLAHCEQTGA